MAADREKLSEELAKDAYADAVKAGDHGGLAAGTEGTVKRWQN